MNLGERNKFYSEVPMRAPKQESQVSSRFPPLFDPSDLSQRQILIATINMPSLCNKSVDSITKRIERAPPCLPTSPTRQEWS